MDEIVGRDLDAVVGQLGEDEVESFADQILLEEERSAARGGAEKDLDHLARAIDAGVVDDEQLERQRDRCAITRQVLFQKVARFQFRMIVLTVGIGLWFS